MGKASLTLHAITISTWAEVSAKHFSLVSQQNFMKNSSSSLEHSDDVRIFSPKI